MLFMDQDLRPASSIKFADYNPNEMDKNQFDQLGDSLTKLGDLSPIVENQQTGNLVAGEHRVKLLLQEFGDAVIIEISERFAERDEFGTVALGYVKVQNTNLRLAYRLVDWPLHIEQTANGAANNIHGKANDQKLADMIASVNAVDVNLTKIMGQSEKKIKKLLQMSSAPEAPAAESGDEAPANGPGSSTDNPARPEFIKRTYMFTREQAEIIFPVFEHIRRHNDFALYENHDEDGNAIFVMAREYSDKQSGLIEAAAGENELTTFAIDE